MNNERFCNSLVNQGYVILRQCISSDLVSECKNAITFRLGQILEEKGINRHQEIYLDFLQAIIQVPQHDVQVALSKYLLYQDIQKKFLLEPMVLEKLIAVLGPDLQLEASAELAVNVKDVKDDYLIKKYHQEFWSGCGVNTLCAWIPLAIEPGMGSLELIEESHTWGHVPHRNREPIDIPTDATTTILEIEEGDMLFFHSLLLHRTAPNRHEYPRFGMPMQVKNFHEIDTSYEDLKRWETFNYSPMSQIRKKLGNPHLSPFRTYDSDRTQYFTNST